MSTSQAPNAFSIAMWSIVVPMPENMPSRCLTSASASSRVAARIRYVDIASDDDAVDDIRLAARAPVCRRIRLQADASDGLYSRHVANDRDTTRARAARYQ